jgi:hypothetical protein
MSTAAREPTMSAKSSDAVRLSDTGSDVERSL